MNGRVCVVSATFSLFPRKANNMNMKSTQTAKQNAAAAGGKIKAWNIAPGREGECCLPANRTNEGREDKCRLAARHSHVGALSFTPM